MSGFKAARPTGIQRLQGWKAEPSRKGGLADCTLVVATYKRPAKMLELLKCLDGLFDTPGEVVIVDGSPGRETENAVLEWVKARDLQFGLAYVSTPAGLTRQRNVGVDASSRDYVFFLDDDCLPLPGYFSSIAQVFRNDERGEVVAVCGSIINHMGRPLSNKWRVRLFLGLLPSCEGLKYYPTATSGPFSIVAPFSGLRPVDVVPGGASAYRRTIFDRHRFSEFFSGYAQGEDLEMSRRIASDGMLLWCGDAHVRHLPGTLGKPDSFQRGRMEVTNRYFIWRRHSPHPELSDRLRFWADIFYSMTCDTVGFVSKPRRGWMLRHALGTGRGVIDCIFAPPKYEEPAARKEYEICLRELTAGKDCETAT